MLYSVNQSICICCFFFNVLSSSGTSKQHVAYDYAKRLAQGVAACQVRFCSVLNFFWFFHTPPQALSIRKRVSVENGFIVRNIVFSKFLISGCDQLVIQQTAAEIVKCRSGTSCWILSPFERFLLQHHRKKQAGNIPNVHPFLCTQSYETG